MHETKTIEGLTCHIGERRALRAAFLSGRVSAEELPDSPEGWRARYLWLWKEGNPGKQGLETLNRWWNREGFRFEDAVLFLEVTESAVPSSAGEPPRDWETALLHRRMLVRFSEMITNFQRCESTWEETNSPAVREVVLKRALDIARDAYERDRIDEYVGVLRWVCEKTEEDQRRENTVALILLGKLLPEPTPTTRS